MKTSLPAVLLLLGLVTCGSASFLEDLLGFDCVDREESCNTFNRPCCDEDVCYFAGGWEFSNANNGKCVENILDNQACQRDNQCKEPSLCQKKHPKDINGECGPLYENGVRCYKDSQCATDNCVPPRAWHMFGKCAEEDARPEDLFPEEFEEEFEED